MNLFNLVRRENTVPVDLCQLQHFLFGSLAYMARDLMRSLTLYHVVIQTPHTDHKRAGHQGEPLKKSQTPLAAQIPVRLRFVTPGGKTDDPCAFHPVRIIAIQVVFQETLEFLERGGRPCV